MYIVNSQKIRGATYCCHELVGKYLEKNGIPVLAKVDNHWQFKQNERLQKALSTLPLYLRFLIKVGVIYG